MPCADFSTCLDDELTSSSIVGLVPKNMPVMSIAQCNLSPLSVLRDPDTCHDMFGPITNHQSHPLLRDFFPHDDEFSLTRGKISICFPPFF
jgi:hypothetical protein